jgi:transducin (beta)-like 1
MADEAQDDYQPATREALSSNVVNYLVWRYLQEAGFAMAATWLGKEWHREPDKVMPFKQFVKQYQLVHMLQDALFLDDVRARGDRVRLA